MAVEPPSPPCKPIEKENDHEGAEDAAVDSPPLVEIAENQDHDENLAAGTRSGPSTDENPPPEVVNDKQ